MATVDVSSPEYGCWLRSSPSLERIAMEVPAKEPTAESTTDSDVTYRSSLLSFVVRLDEDGGEENLLAIAKQLLPHANELVSFPRRGNTQTMQEMSNEFNSNARAIELKIHSGKTQWMKNEYCPGFDMKLEKENVELVHSYSIWGMRYKDLGEKSSRRRRAGCIFTKLRDILTDRKALPHVKAELFNSTILYCLYGRETWNTTFAQERELAMTQRAMERRMEGISMLQHMPNEVLRSRSSVKEIVETVHARKHTWAGHVGRMNDSRWTKRITEWYPQNITKPGRPPLRWRDRLMRVHGITWMRQAQYRTGCKHGCQLHRWGTNQ
ncbi:unnamed protein product [Toxocara canis]|uniref:Reverse transcriptase domain-containing protein n=1 Tax=Toxocara canis TaxID=6265 RepID=A0A183VC44_TOXCA|nr:unnamed protein product [Toxocara canis]